MLSAVLQCLVTWSWWKAQWEQGTNLSIFGLSLHSTVIRSTTQQWITWINGWCDGLLIQRKSLDSKLYDNWKNVGRSGLSPFRHNMEMALISLCLSRKRVGILQRLQSYWPMPSLTIKSNMGDLKAVREMEGWAIRKI